MDYSKLNFLILLILFCFLHFLFTVKPKPTYNPFDDLFQVDTKKLERDGCYYFFMECLGKILRYETADYAINYHLTGEDSDIIYAKEFSFFVDTIPRKFYEERELFYYFEDTFSITAPALIRLSNQMHEFGTYINQVLDDGVEVISFNQRDTFYLEKKGHTYLVDSMVVQILHCYIYAPLTPEQKWNRFYEKQFLLVE